MKYSSLPYYVRKDYERNDDPGDKSRVNGNDAEHHNDLINKLSSVGLADTLPSSKGPLLANCSAVLHPQVGLHQEW